MSLPAGAIHAGEGLVMATGKFDLATAPILRRALWAAVAARPDTITVDVNKVIFVDLAAISVIAEARAAAHRGRMNFAVHGAEGIANELLRLDGLVPLHSAGLRNGRSMDSRPQANVRASTDRSKCGGNLGSTGRWFRLDRWQGV